MRIFLLLLTILFSFNVSAVGDEPYDPDEEWRDTDWFDDFFNMTWRDQEYYYTFFNYVTEGGDLVLALINHSDEVYATVTYTNGMGDGTYSDSSGLQFGDWYDRTFGGGGGAPQP